ncbi:hypothetical protein HO173_010080 [Letharia columbiana]|uniref:FAD-binding PCMH-type domain-containing protein n=1 Tax=Letharia columbiana TaxID=112416 RepID=A0A8H6FNN7_9LECA|nr:uncharacterized protein HO173_010080 [Letharia columbiana]KAF6231778.1 hypothetical protein HO173_010080 [Letharia columbiana]
MSKREDEVSQGHTSPDALASLLRELKEALEYSIILTPDSEGYLDSIKRWSDEVEKRAGVVVYVGSAQDIASTILLSRKHSISFVVAGGKHSSSGAASTDGGLVIDLAKMRKVEIDTSKKIAKVQGGCIWQDVDEAAANHGLAMVGGTVNHTGVGGLTLGGGYGWLSGRYGLTIDSLLQVQIVLGDGSINTASENENPDLFWAVRGAGHGFGVVSEFVFETHEQKNNIWSGQMIWPASTKLGGVIDFANDLLTKSDPDSAMVLGVTAPPFMTEPAVVATVFHNGSQGAAERIFKPLLNLQPLKNSAQERPYREMNGMMNHAVPYGGRKLSKGACFVPPLSADYVRSLIVDMQKLHQTVPGSRRSIVLFEYLHPEAWCKIPNDATAFANRGRHQNVMIGPFWDNAEDDQKIRLWATEIAKKAEMELERVKEEAGSPAWMEHIGEYGNYDGLLTNARRIFGSNFDKLRSLKIRYDPDNVFDKSHSLLSAREE